MTKKTKPGTAAEPIRVNKSEHLHGKDTNVKDFRKRTPEEPDELPGPDATNESQVPEQNGAPTDIEPTDIDPALTWKDVRCYSWCFPRKGLRKITNFIIEPHYLLRHPSEPKRVFSIVNTLGERVMLCKPTKELTPLNGFKSIVEGHGNFIASLISEQYDEIKKIWFAYEKQAIEVSPLGYIPGTKLFAWANGIFDGQTFTPANEFGIVGLKGQMYFIPALSKMYVEDLTEFESERKFRHFLNSNVTFEEWARLFNEVFSENDNGCIGIIYACASAFYTTITGHTNHFPILFCFGMPRTGKSTFRDALLYLFGQPQDAISLESASTTKGFSRKLAQFRDGLNCFEEYKNNIDKEKIGMVKGTYDKIGNTKAATTNDTRTKSTPVLSAVMVCGQELPTKETALFTRTITVEFSSDVFSDQQRKAKDLLKQMQDKGVTSATLEILKCRDLIESNFSTMLKWVKERLHSMKNGVVLPKTLDDRAIGNVAIYLAVYKVLEGSIKFPFTYAHLENVFLSKLRLQVEMMEKTNETSQFWNAVDVLISEKKLIEGRDYKVRKVENEDWLFFYPATTFSAYANYQRLKGAHALDDSTLKRYLKKHPGFRPNYKENRDDHLVKLKDPEDRIGSPKTGKRCIAFELSSTGISLE